MTGQGGDRPGGLRYSQGIRLTKPKARGKSGELEGVRGKGGSEELQSTNSDHLMCYLE